MYYIVCTLSWIPIKKKISLCSNVDIHYIIEALQEDFIVLSTSPASVSFFFVEKKVGGLRPCIDYHGLNNVTVRYPYPLPLVPTALEQLCSDQIFTKLNLCSNDQPST